MDVSGMHPRYGKDQEDVPEGRKGVGQEVPCAVCTPHTVWEHQTKGSQGLCA